MSDLSNDTELVGVADILICDIEPWLYLAIPVNRRLRRQTAFCWVVNRLFSWLDIRCSIVVIKRDGASA